MQRYAKPRHSLLTLVGKSGLFVLKIPLIWLILLTAVACLSKYLRKPQRENSMSEAMRRPSFQKVLHIHSIYQIIVNLWNQNIELIKCVYLFETILSARNYSATIGTIRPFPALVILRYLVSIYASYDLCSSGADFVAAALIEARQTVG